MRLRIYAYEKCGTCRQALKFLDARGLKYEVIAIRDRPPAKADLRRVLGRYGGNLRKLFNSSGQDYKRLSLKDKLPKMTADEAIELLAHNGRLVKRPFVLTDAGGCVGFNQTEWEQLLK